MSETITQDPAIQALEYARDGYLNGMIGASYHDERVSEYRRLAVEHEAEAKVCREKAAAVSAALEKLAP